MLRTSAYSLLAASALALGSLHNLRELPGRPPIRAPRAATSVPARRRRWPSTVPSWSRARAASPTVAAVPVTPVTPSHDAHRPDHGIRIRGPRITSPIIFGNGQSGAFTGEAFVIPSGTTRLPNLSDLIPFATLFTNSFEVKTQAFSGGFPGALRQDDWFAIRYEGDFIIEGDGLAEFRSRPTTARCSRSTARRSSTAAARTRPASPAPSATWSTVSTTCASTISRARRVRSPSRST